MRTKSDIILNLTQHSTTLDQLKAKVVEPCDKAKVKELLTFETLPTKQEVESRATELAAIANQYHCRYAMIGGAPFLMEPLQRHLSYAGIRALFSFSVRQSVEEVVDNEVQKKTIFRHTGFYGYDDI